MKSQNPTHSNDVGERNREIRIALVLYGGVSLAVYENGVTRSFFDLVKGNGVFSFLKVLLDADAVVDIVAGTSAGGINGLMLAAALESGADFRQTANLWREHGDFGALLRSVSEADQAESLLSGEEYYQEKLIDAFKDLVKEVPGTKSPGEIDVFITGTDIDGHEKIYWDSLGNKIEDKSHRTVFHLKHRPGRKYLGLAANSQKSANTDNQAAILASIARITSTFPFAFPPFQIEQVPNSYQDAVRTALMKTSGISGDRTYVDGGVLDNKPFGPAVNAIFYRMPYKIVDRRLFYVEPDPQVLTSVPVNKENRSYNPLGIALSALTTIPSYEGVSEDLEKLKQHNTRIKWLSDIKNLIPESVPKQKSQNEKGSSGWQVYRSVRIDSLAKALLLEVDEVPAAQHELKNPEREKIFRRLKSKLEDYWKTSNEDSIINSCDIDFHIRRAFYLQYQLYEQYQKDPEKYQKEKDALRAIGRIIKLLKIIRSSLYGLRDEIMSGRTDIGIMLPDSIFKLFANFLNADGNPWNRITTKLRELSEATAMVPDLGDRVKGPLSSANLTNMIKDAREIIKQLAENNLSEKINLHEGPSILDVTAETLQQVVIFCRRSDELYSAFDLIDQVFFPLEYASNIHELDEIEVVRISPRDADIGLSSLESYKKVTGDELAHFAAFFRRDWRSNDILWGRLDSICQIIHSLLGENALKDLLTRKKIIEKLLTEWKISESGIHCPDEILQGMQSAQDNFLHALKNCPMKTFGSSENGVKESAEHETEESDKDLVKAFERFKENLILAAQHDAAHDDLPLLYEDIYFQEISWGTCQSEKSAAESSGTNVIAAASKRLGNEASQKIKNSGEEFKKMAIGTQTVVGPRGQVPKQILGQYATQTYLIIWGILNTAFGGRKIKVPFLGYKKTRIFFRSPVLFIYYMIESMRKEKNLYYLIVASIASALVTGLVIGIFTKEVWLIIVPLIVLIVFIPVINWLSDKMKMGTDKK